MFSVIHLRAPNDNNGNPRRCFAVFRHGTEDNPGSRYSQLVAVVDEGYGGTGELDVQMRGFGVKDKEYCFHCQVNVTASEYKNWLRSDPR